MKPVDVLRVESKRRELKVLLPHIMKVSDPDQRYKSLVAAAWSFAVEGELEEMTKLLNLVPADYVRETMPYQMAQDPYFDAMCEAITNTIIEGKVHDPVYVAPKTSYVAKAGAA